MRIESLRSTPEPNDDSADDQDDHTGEVGMRSTAALRLVRSFTTRCSRLARVTCDASIGLSRITTLRLTATLAVRRLVDLS